MFNFIISFIIVFYASFSFANLAYITNEKDNTVSVIDIDKKKVVFGHDFSEIGKKSYLNKIVQIETKKIYPYYILSKEEKKTFHEHDCEKQKKDPPQQAF